MPKILGKSLIGDSNISFVDAALVSVPNTQISNRALIRNLAADMGARLGIERIMSQQIIEVQNEFGPSGERVFKMLNDDKDQVRFVGGWTNITDDSGSRASPTVVGDFIEVSFYGTGLNLLLIAYSGTGDLRATVDGGSEGANLVTAYSNTLLSRKYASNQVLSVTSGLSVGLHTVKLRVVTPTPNIYGFEILNESTSIRVNQGTLIKDQRRFSLDVAQTIAYKPASLTNGRGGRVIVYNSGGQIAQAVQPVNASQQNLASADHSNEEVARVYHFREFGSGRSDDFSSLSTSSSDRAFTLDDGTTTLTGHNTQIYSGGREGPSFNGSAGDYVSIAFVGTGLDWIEGRGLSVISTFTTTAVNVTVDGTSIGSGTLTSFGWIPGSKNKVVSGLPYGTHTVRFTLTASGNLPNMSQFVVYQPKKPSVPSGALELADYNVMADFAANTTAGLDTIATGVLRKMLSVREPLLVGTWSTAASPTDTGLISQFATSTSTSGNYAEYTFFGTGFEYRARTTATRSNNISVTLNGLAATTANFPSMVTSVYGGPAFASGTLNMNASTQDAAGFRLSGLPLGKYTVRFTNNTSNLFALEGFDIIAPIHSHKSNVAADLQNSLPIGSCSLGDSRQLVASNVIVAKAWAQAVGISSAPTTTSTSFIPVPDMSVAFKSSGGRVAIHGRITAGQTAGNQWTLGLFIDGVNVFSTVSQTPSAGYDQPAFVYEAVLSAGIHKIDLYWLTASNTLAALGTSRLLTVQEL